MSLVVRKPAFCVCENKGADQLLGDREADQRLCFRYTDCTIPLPPKSEISSLYPSSVAVQPGLCQTWSETPKTGFLTTRLKYMSLVTRKPVLDIHSIKVWFTDVFVLIFVLKHIFWVHFRAIIMRQFYQVPTNYV